MGEENSLMEDLAEAWDAAESEETPDEGLPEPTDTEPDTDDAIGGPEDSADQPDAAERVSGEEEPVQAAETDPDTPVVDEDKPPAGLAPAAREAWKDVPDAVKAEIRKREQDYERGVMKYAEGAKRAQAMDKVLSPYSQFFAMNGGPGQTIPGVLQTASVLQMGSPIQKAQTVAQLIKQFGVDVSTLDGLLVGEQPQADPNQMVAQLVDQRLQAFQQQQQAQQAQRAQQAIGSEIDQFSNDPKNEFYNDVSGDMADLLEVTANRGQAMTLQEAYERACAMNPQVSQILAARKAQSSVNTKRKAAVSVTGSPGGPGTSEAPNSLRSALEQAWDTAGRD